MKEQDCLILTDDKKLFVGDVCNFEVGDDTVKMEFAIKEGAWTDGQRVGIVDILRKFRKTDYMTIWQKGTTRL